MTGLNGEQAGASVSRRWLQVAARLAVIWCDPRLAVGLAAFVGRSSLGRHAELLINYLTEPRSDDRLAVEQTGCSHITKPPGKCSGDRRECKTNVLFELLLCIESYLFAHSC